MGNSSHFSISSIDVSELAVATLECRTIVSLACLVVQPSSMGIGKSYCRRLILSTDCLCDLSFFVAGCADGFFGVAHWGIADIGQLPVN